MKQRQESEPALLHLPTQLHTDRQLRDHETEAHQRLREEYLRKMIQELGQA